MFTLDESTAHLVPRSLPFFPTAGCHLHSQPHHFHFSAAILITFTFFAAILITFTFLPSIVTNWKNGLIFTFTPLPPHVSCLTYYLVHPHHFHFLVKGSYCGPASFQQAAQPQKLKSYLDEPRLVKRDRDRPVNIKTKKQIVSSNVSLVLSLRLDIILPAVVPLQDS